MDWEILRKESIYSNFKTKDLRKKTRKVLLETRKWSIILPKCPLNPKTCPAGTGKEMERQQSMPLAT